MKHLVMCGLMVLALVGCGGGGSTATETTSAAATETSTETSASAASGCTASGLDAMTALADFQLEMDDAQKAGKITQDQLLAGRDKLFDQTQEAQAKEDWSGYCKAIDDMWTELGL